MYVFAPECLWCERNLDNIKKLSELVQNKYRLVGLSMSSSNLQEYVTSHGLNFPVYKEPTAESVLAYKPGGTPRTIIISPEGRVVKNWYGAYAEEAQKEVEEFFIPLLSL